MDLVDGPQPSEVEAVLEADPLAASFRPRPVLAQLLRTCDTVPFKHIKSRIRVVAGFPILPID